MRKTLGTIGLLTALLTIYMVTPVSASYSLYENSGILWQCFLGYCSSPQESGVQATLTPTSMVANATLGQTLAYWVGIDWFSTTGQHYWIQGGIVEGITPTGTASHPMFYYEYNNCNACGSTPQYNFTPLYQTSLGTSHTIAVYCFPCSYPATGLVVVDGVNELVLPNCNGPCVGTVSGTFEAHVQGAFPSGAATWTNLQFMDSNSHWHSWNWNDGFGGQYSISGTWTCGSAYYLSVYSNYFAVTTGTTPTSCGGGGGGGGSGGPPKPVGAELDGLSQPPPGLQINFTSPAFLVQVALILLLVGFGAWRYRQGKKKAKYQDISAKGKPSL